MNYFFFFLKHKFFLACLFLSLIFAVQTLSFPSSAAFRDMKAVDSAPYLFIVSETQSLSEAVTKSPQLVVISRLVIHQIVTVKLVTVKATLIHAPGAKKYLCSFTRIPVRIWPRPEKIVHQAGLPGSYDCLLPPVLRSF